MLYFKNITLNYLIMSILKTEIWLFLILFACNPKQNKNEANEGEIKKISIENYNLEKPNKEYILPAKLKEISGLSPFSETEIICVNDEQGKIFIYDLIQEKISNTIEFGKSADYEGVEIVGNTIYVLNSTGKIKTFNLKSEETDNIDCSQKQVDEYEGLGFDAQTNCLLLAAKEMKGNKKIYSYNLSNKSLETRLEITENLIEKNNWGRDFKPSGLAVNPSTQHVFILASSGKKLIVVDNNGIKIKQYNLSESLFPQPEGICFSKNGDLLIANEGKNGNGNILLFKNNIVLQ